MDTSGGSTVFIVAFFLVLVVFFQVAFRLVLQLGVRRAFPVVAPVLVVLIGVPSLLQHLWPPIGEALARDPSLTLEHGQWWRVLTAVMAQDGGLVAAIFNLIVLAAVATLAEWIWGRWRTVLFFLLPSVLLNLLALAWNAPGGGSSFATQGLMMSVVGLGLMISRSTLVRVLAIVAIVVSIVLVVLNDAHGVAQLIGVALGVIAALVRRPRK